MMSDAVKAVILGIIEGITEFLPVSSTGHMLLAQRFFALGEGAFWQSFVILIQLGAILAIVMLYFFKLWRVALGMFTNPDDRRFVIGVLVAFLPAVVVGLAVGKYIKELLFNPWVVCFTLIVGGAILLWVDQLDLKPHEDDATRYPLMMYLWIGIAQCVAMIPGVSRSGASIVAAMLLGADKRSAAEFSFFLAIPTMVGAFAYDFYKNRGEMTIDHVGIIAMVEGTEVSHHRDDRGEDGKLPHLCRHRYRRSEARGGARWQLGAAADRQRADGLQVVVGWRVVIGSNASGLRRVAAMSRPLSPNCVARGLSWWCSSRRKCAPMRSSTFNEPRTTRSMLP